MDTLHRRRRALVPLVVFALAALVAGCATPPTTGGAQPVANGMRTSAFSSPPGSAKYFTASADSVHIQKVGEDSARAYFTFAGTVIVDGTNPDDLQTIDFAVADYDSGFQWADLNSAGPSQTCGASNWSITLDAFGFGGGITVPKIVCAGESVTPVPDTYPYVRWSAGDGGVDTGRQVPIAFMFSVPKATATTTWRPNMTIWVTAVTSICGMWGCNGGGSDQWNYHIPADKWTDWH